MGGWFRRELKSAADMQGLRFRIAGFAGRVIERLGGVPSNLPGSEVYPALEAGRLDAAEWVGPYDDLKLGFHRVAPYYYYPGWWEGCAHIDILINRKAWAALPRELQTVVEAASSMTHVDMQAKYDARNPVALKQLVGQGARLRPFPADLMTEAFKASMRLNEELAAKNPHWRRIYTEYSRFRADQNLWFRFTEAGFDRFMQSQKL
jgi:TRAP-type mannitol/chloroaromatic compound transport system substrate-binding protein